MPMKLTIRFCTAFACFLLLGFKATPLPKLAAPLPESEKASAVVVYLEQTEIAVDGVDVEGGNAGVLGVLVAGIVENSVASHRQRAIAPLRDAMLDFQFEEKLISALHAHLPTSMVQADASIKIVRNDTEWRAYLRKNIPSTIFRVAVRYAFEQNLDIAYLLEQPNLLRFERMPLSPEESKSKSKQERAKALPTVLYAGSFYSEHVTHDPLHRDPQAKGQTPYKFNAASWAEQSAEPLKQALLKSANEVAELVQRDADTGLPPASSGKKVRAYMAHAIAPAWVNKAMQVEQSGDRSLLLIGQNTHWIDNRQIKP